MKKKILICSLLIAPSISVYADLVTSSKAIEQLSMRLSKGAYNVDDLDPPNVPNVQTRIKNSSVSKQSAKQTTASVSQNVNKPQEPIDSQRYVYMYKDKEGVTRLTNKVSDDANLKLEKVTDLRKKSDQIITIDKKNTRSFIVASDGSLTEVAPKKANGNNNAIAESSKSISNPFSRQEYDYPPTNIAKYYKPTEFRVNLESLESKENIKIYDLTDTLVDFASLAEQGYEVLGTSKFMDRQIIKSDIIKQAKKVGSSLVLVKETTDSTIYYRKGDDPKNFDIIYDYVITFYGKYDFSKKLNMLGINIQTIPIEARSLFQRNTGVYVANVIINSKAFNANVLRGDVIVSINGIELLRPEDLDTLKNEQLAKTKTLTLKILRIVKGDLKEIEIPISF